MYEASGILQNIDQDVLDTRVVQYASASSQLEAIQLNSHTNNDDNHVREPIYSWTTNVGGTTTYHNVYTEEESIALDEKRGGGMHA